MAIVSATEQIGIGATTTIDGSLDANTGLNAVPADAGSFSASESYENILDTGRRGGSEAMDFYAYQGVGLSEISFDFPMMYGQNTTQQHTTGAILGILLRNILGTGANSESATATAPIRGVQVGAVAATETYFRLGTSKEYLHVARNLVGSSKDELYTGCRVSNITISANAGEGPVTISTSMTGLLPTIGAAQTIGSKTLSNNVAMGFENTRHATTRNQPFIFGNSIYNVTPTHADNRLISAEITLAREVSTVYTLSNSQSPNDIYLGPLEVTFSCVAEVATADLDDYRAGTIGKTLFSFSSGNTTADVNSKELVIGMQSTTPMEAPMELDTSGAYTTVSYSGRALATTDSLAISGDSYATTRTPVEVLIMDRSHGTSTNVPKYQ